jgi:NADH-quinone oxidoreductase subunit M
MNGSTTSVPWLTILALVPLVGAVLMMAVPRGGVLPKQVALGISGVALAISIIVALQYDTDGGFQFVEKHEWITTFGAHYALGVDGLGLLLVLLTTILTPVVILASWNDADEARWSVNAFFALMLSLEGLSIGVFSATDVFLFYVLFEATLIPIYFLIGGFGGPQRSYAAVKFLLYSLFGGLLMLASVIGLYVVSSKTAGGPSYLLQDLMNLHLDQNTGRWLFLGFFVAFAVKAPMWPLHTWLPDAASEATPGTSVLLVSILDKIGTFGMMRFCLGLFPEASKWASPVIMAFAVFSIIYGALLAIGQNDIRRLIAYTSISHFGFIVLGIFALTSTSQAGAALYMFNHGLSTGALFLVTGFLISRRGSKMISDYGGVEKVAPVLAGLFLLTGLSSLSLPGLSPFVSEFLVLTGTFSVSIVAAAVAVLGIVLAAIYILLMYQRTMTGPERESTRKLPDLNVREIAALTPLLALIVVLGFFPKPALDALNPTVTTLLQHVDKPDPTPTSDLTVPTLIPQGAPQ